LKDTIMAESDGGGAGTEFVGSHEKAKNGYGQNGYQGASSQLPGDAPVRMDRDFGLAADPSAAPGDWQTRKVDATPYSTHPGMRSPNSKLDAFPSANVRPASKRAMGGNYQR
jgi:hypothetical protein